MDTDLPDNISQSKKNEDENSVSSEACTVNGADVINGAKNVFPLQSVLDALMGAGDSTNAASRTELEDVSNFSNSYVILIHCNVLSYCFVIVSYPFLNPLHFRE